MPHSVPQKEITPNNHLICKGLSFLSADRTELKCSIHKPIQILPTNTTKHNTIKVFKGKRNKVKKRENE